MKIIHLLGSGKLPKEPFSTPMGGLVTAVLEIAHIQAARGHQVAVAAASIENWKSSWENVTLLGLKFFPWALIRYKQQTLDFRRHLAFLIHCSTHRYDIIHGHLYYYLRGLPARKRITHFHNDPLKVDEKFIRLPSMQADDFNNILANTDAQIAVSQFIADQLRVSFNGKGNVHVVHNGVNQQRFSVVNSISRTKLRQQYNIPEDAKIILYTGEVSNEKGVIYLAEAFRNLCQKLTNAYLLIVGDSDLWGDDILGTPEAEYARNIKKVLTYEIKSGRAIFAGKKAYSDMPYFYYMSDIHVVPSIWNEAFSLNAMEALAMGLPVISTRTGGLADYLNDCNSIKVAPGNIEELQSAILRLITDNSLYSSLSAQARQDAAKYTWENSVDKIMQIYK
jgi:glycosyltransferase involved in cell wall biosynthesis